MAKRAQPGTKRAPAKPRRAKSKAQFKSKAGSKARVRSTFRQRPLAPPPEAFEIYERAIRAMQRHEYAEGAAEFQALIEGFPTERALLDRARVHIEMSQRELQASLPKTVEERMTAATAVLNDGDEGRAEALAKGILAEDDGNDMALYLLAIVEMRRDAQNAALAYLARAIALSPEAAAQARLDADFATIRETAAFRALTETPPHPRPKATRLPGRRR